MSSIAASHRDSFLLIQSAQHMEAIMRRTTVFFVIFMLFLPLSLASQTWMNFTTANGLGGNDIVDGMMDSQGNIWFTTYGGGVSKFGPTGWTVYNTGNSGIVSNQIYSVTEDSAGNMWFGGVGTSSVSKFDGTTWTTYTNADAGLFAHGYEMTTDDSGNVWIASIANMFADGGLFKFDGTTWTMYDTANSDLPHNSLTYIAFGDSGSMWLGTLNKGVILYRDSSWTVYDSADGIALKSVDEIALDDSGRIWVACHDGVGVLDDTTWTSYTPSDGLVNAWSTALAFDAAGNTWIGTAGGVSKFDGTTWTNYTTADGLIYSDTRAIIVDRDQNIWMGTQHGVSRLGSPIGVNIAVSDSLTADPGDTIAVPISASPISTADSILSFQFSLRFQNDVLHYIGYDTAGTGLLNATITDTIYGSTATDSLSFAAAMTTVLNPGSQLITLKFRVDSAAAPGDSSEIDIRTFAFNEGSPIINSIQDGAFTVAGDLYTYGDVDQSGSITPYDATLVLLNVIGGYPMDALTQLIADVSGNGEIFAYDAALILRYYVGLITTFPVGTSFTYPKSAAPAPVPGGVMEFVRAESAGETEAAYHLSLSGGSSVSAGNWELQFNGEHFAFAGVRPSDWSRDCIIESRVDGGTIHIALAVTGELEGDGTLFTIFFERITDGDLNLEVLEAVLNETRFTNVAVDGAIPATFGLSQNYPNPFNPTTSISYSIPEESHVAITIYSILGREVRTLVSNVQPAGRYTLHWDGKDNFGRGVASGVYFYRMETKSFAAVRKMLFIK